MKPISKCSPQPLPSTHAGTEIERGIDLVHQRSSNKKTVSELESKTNNDKPIPEKVVTNENWTKKQPRVAGENTSAGLKTKGAFNNANRSVSVHVSFETENGPEMSLDFDVKEEVLGGENDAHDSSPHIGQMEDLASDVHGEAMSRDTEMVKEEVLEDESETHDSSPHEDQMEDSSTDENDESDLPISFETANKALKKVKLRKCTEEVLMAAAMYVKEGNSSIAVAARMFGVPRTTLSARIRGRRPQLESTCTILTVAEETKLVNWFKEASQRGCPPTRLHMLATVRAMLQNNNRKTPFNKDGPGKTWYKLFLKRHPEVWLSPEEKKTKFTQEKHQRWFTNALREINLIDANVLNQPERIFSCHESIFQFNGVIAKSLTKSRHKHRVNAMNTYKRATVLACGSASGEVLQPLMTFTSTLGDHDLSEGFREALSAMSPNGLINTNIFKKWLEKAFIPAIRDLARPVFLFMDGNKIHCNMTVSDVCKDHGVILYQLPSQFIHPMDLTAFSALGQSWREEVLNFRDDTGNDVVNKNFAKVFRKAWEGGMEKKQVVSRFSEAGLYPWNTDIIDITEFQHSDGIDEREESVVPEETSDDQGQSDEKHGDGKPSDGDFSVDKQGLSYSNRSSASLLQFTSANQSALPLHSDNQSLNRDSILPTDPFPSCNSVTSLPTTTADDESSALPPLCLALRPTSAVSDFNDYRYFKSTATAPRIISNAQALDKLLSIAATIGSCKLTAFLTTFEYNRNYELPDPLFGPFCNLYNRLANVATASDLHENGVADGESSFGTVPLSTLAISQFLKRRKQATTKAKSLKSNLSSVECTTFVKEQKKTKNETNMKKRKVAETEDKEIIKEREYKKIKESESEEKKGKQIQNGDDIGKAVIFEKKPVKETMKSQNKVRDPCLELGQLSGRTIVVDPGGSDEDTAVTELLDTDICVGCMGEKDDETNEWIGCECGRWYHVGCANDIRLLGKSMKEIRNLVFTCPVCRKRKK